MEPVKEINLYPKQIPGGFYLKARKIEDSEIAHVAPSIREVWDWILRQCNHKDTVNIKRGQCVRRISDIQDGLFWMVGYRKMMYSKTQCEHALEFLRKKQMITTTKTTRGLIITVCNYDSYQNIKNYEYNGEDNKKTTRRQQQGDTINKNDNNDNSSTPLREWIYSHNGFFDRQLEKSKDEPELGKYQKLVEFLHEKDEEGKYKFSNVLSLEKQISYKDYIALKETEKQSTRTLKEVLEGMEDRKSLSKDHKNVYLTAKAWLKIEFKK